MFTAVHVIVALLSLATATVNHFRPAKQLLGVSYGLAGSTLASGVLLVVFSQASIIRTCVSGIVFFGIVSVLNESARQKITNVAQKNSLS